MADIEQELTAYAERRAGGRSTQAALLVANAAQAYRAAVRVLQRHGAGSNKFWRALEAVSGAVDGILYGLQGEPDYYFGARQYAEFVLPALQAAGTARAFPAGEQIAFVGDFVVHTHCEDLSLAQQLAGVRELCRHLALIERERGSQAQRTMHLCLLNSLAKVGFVSTARSLNGTRDDFGRQVHPEVELEAARGGALHSTLRLLSSPSGPTLLGVPTNGDTESHVLYIAQRMAKALAHPSQKEAGAQLCDWVLQQPIILQKLHTRLQRPALEHPVNGAFTYLLVCYLGCCGENLAEQIRSGGLLRTLEQRFQELWGSPYDDLVRESMTARTRLRVMLDISDAPDSQRGPGQPQQAQQSQQPPASREQLQALPVRELKARLAAAGIDSSGCAEKRELVDLLLQSSGGSGGGGGGRGQRQAAGDPANAAGAVQQRARHSKQCLQCGASCGPEGRKLKLCAGCRLVHFCSVDCQRAAWPGHREACQAAAGDAAEA
ncbi:hypothetical protein COHA_001765 [Chlorella ohadii]|uniref:MYND-type domain-containing protein n=1 Tax=Chlorella ohadii TaxID=2649997 RepID=A0AAD5DX71_9CHLO|nr:hypothetical protein COHA_001765 [Chlorella ohadii]